MLQLAIRDTVAKLDPTFGYADSLDEVAGRYRNLIWAKDPPDITAPTAVLVRAAEALDQLNRDAANVAAPAGPGGMPSRPGELASPNGGSTGLTEPQSKPSNPHRFYGSVEIDMVRPIKSFESILNAVVMELQRTHGAKVTLTLEVEATAAGGFAEGEVGIVRDNAKQLKFKAESTGFGRLGLIQRLLARTATDVGERRLSATLLYERRFEPLSV